VGTLFRTLGGGHARASAATPTTRRSARAFAATRTRSNARTFLKTRNR